MKDRQREGGGLSGAGAGDGKDILAGEDVGEAAPLDRGGAADSEGGAGGDGPVGEAEVREGEGGRWVGVAVVGGGGLLGD
ncbi:uncharacterized protein A4U43_C08F9370 [Asparagus officinalis]|nr:uncharacterized protein A4U43_C08F9370 [Asparagus officinalis]